MRTSQSLAATATWRFAAAATPQTVGTCLGLAAALIWGAYLAMARSGVNAGLEPTDLAALRYVVAGLIMLPWLLRDRFRSLVRLGVRKVAILTVLAGPPFVLIGVSGYKFAPLAHGAVVQPAMLTIGSMVLAVAIFGDKPTRARLAGVAVIIAGLVVLAGPGLLAGGALTPLGDILFAMAGLMWAVFAIASKKWGVTPLAGTAVISVVAAAIYGPLYWATIGLDRLFAVPAPMLVAQVIVQGVLSGVVAVLAYSQAVHILGPGRAALFPGLVPAVAVLIGIPITGEWPTAIQWAGLLVVTAGLLIALGVIKPRR
jgi:drug/metabolite transporter (DMT)-like permease